MGGGAHFSWLPAIACTPAERIQLKACQMIVLTRVTTPWSLGWPMHTHEAEQRSFAGFLSLFCAALDLDELVGEGDGEAGEECAVIPLPASCCRQF